MSENNQAFTTSSRIRFGVVGAALSLSLFSVHISAVHAEEALVVPANLRIPELEPAKSFKGEEVMTCPAWIAAGAAVVMAANAVYHNYHERWRPELGSDLVIPQEVEAQIFNVRY